MTMRIAILLLCALVARPSMAQDVSGVMMVVKGEITVTSSKDKKTENAKVGRKVFPGDTITAGKDARAKIVMSDKNILNISPESKVTIEKYTNDPKSDSRNVELKVEYGKVRASVEQKYDGEKSKFNIKTPTAVAGVRGTDFITGFNRQTKTTSIVTFSGTVAVGTPGPQGQIMNPVFVQPGQATEVGAGKAPEAPKPMPKDELNNMNQDSNADVAKGPEAPSQERAPAAEEPKQEAQEPKQEAKQEAKQETKQESKEAKQEPKQEPKQEAKQEAKQEPKQEPKQEARQEPKAEPKSDARQEAKQDPKSSAGNSGSGGKDGKPAAPAEQRRPSSEPSMVNNQDLGRGPAAQPNMNAGSNPKPPLVFNQLPVPTATPPPIVDAINRNGNVKVNIQIKGPQ